MNSPASIDLLGPLVMLPGTGLGYRSALAFGSVVVRLPRAAARVGGQGDDDVDGMDDWATVNAALTTALALPASDRAAGPSTETRVVDDLLALVMALQQSARVPVFESGRSLRVHAQEGPSRRVDFVMPWVLAKPAQLALRGLVDSAAWLLARRADPAVGPDAAALPTADLDGRMAQLLGQLKPHRLPGNNTFRFLKAAHAMDIPSQPVVANVFAFGQGQHQRWLDSSFTERTSVLGTALVRQKHVAAAVLRANGFPVAEHHMAADADAAVRVAVKLGYPVVVKPADLDGGLGVAADLRDDAAVRSAYAQARKHSSRVLVERHVPGQDYRLTVANGRMIKAVHRLPGGVVGDGLLSVAALVDRANTEPRRMKRNRDRAAVLLHIDDEALAMLADDGRTPEHVPALGEFIALRRRANVSTGGEPSLVTDRVHPDNQRLAERAARTLKLDMAGVDLIIGDISRSWLEIGAAICEVNAQPQIGDGTTPQIYADILRGLLPGDARIPVVLVVGEDAAMRAGSVARQVQAEFEARGLRCARASRAGVWMAGLQQVCPGGDWFKAARVVVNLHDAAAAVVVASAEELRGSGLPFDRFQALVLVADATQAAPDQPLLAAALRMTLPHVMGNLVLERTHPTLAWLGARVEPSRLTVVDDAAGDGPGDGPGSDPGDGRGDGAREGPDETAVDRLAQRGRRLALAALPGRLRAEAAR